MKTTVQDLINELNNISEDKKKLPVNIVCLNGLWVYPKIKMVFNTDYDSSSGVKEILLIWD